MNFKYRGPAYEHELQERMKKKIWVLGVREKNLSNKKLDAVEFTLSGELLILTNHKHKPGNHFFFIEIQLCFK